MTLTTDRPRRSELGTVRPTTRPVVPPRPALITQLVLPDVYRVSLGATTVGYIQLAGPVFVGLLGCVYNTSVEVGQHVDLEAALEKLARCHREGDG